MNHQMEPTPSDRLHGALFIGMEVEGSVVRDYSLLRANGIAEKIYTDRNGAKPYSWMANVIAVSVDEFAGKKIAGPVRKEYASSSSVDVPQIIKDLPLADGNTLLIEIHRRLWKNLIRQQDCVCKYCGESMQVDIDLDNIVFLDKDKPKLLQNWHSIVVTVRDGWLFEAAVIPGTDQKRFGEYDGTEFNEFVFRCPTIGDAIRNEKYEGDQVEFWRRIAFDCLEEVYAVETAKGENKGKRLSQLPWDEVKPLYSKKVFDEMLPTAALIQIRETLREGPPTMPFYYLAECANVSCRRETPMTMEANGFFSV
jgi:hypothetical protein